MIMTGVRHAVKAKSLDKYPQSLEWRKDVNVQVDAAKAN